MAAAVAAVVICRIQVLLARQQEVMVVVAQVVQEQLGLGRAWMALAAAAAVRAVLQVVLAVAVVR